MAFSLTKLLKGLRLTQENTTSPANLDLLPAGTANTTTTVTTSQTADHTITLPNETGTVLTTASTIDLDQLEAVTANRALASNGAGHIVSTAVTDTELGYVAGVTSAIQTQLNTTSGSLSTETAARISGDATLTSSKANITLNNILPTTAVDINAQKITNSGTPTAPSDLTTKAYVDAAVTGGGANLSLSNLTSPTSVNQNLLPSSTTINLGQLSGNTFSSLFLSVSGWMKNLIIVDSSMNIQGTFGQSTATIDGSSVSSALFLREQNGGTAPIVKLTSGDNTANSTPTSSIILATGSKGGGTGNSGDIKLVTGTSSGGTKGQVILKGSSIDASNTKIVNVATPTTSTDAVNKAYVDRVRARCYESTGQVVSNLTSTVLNFDQIIYDANSLITPGAGTWKFTAPTTGMYDFEVLVQFANFTSTNYMEITCSIYNSSNVLQKTLVIGQTTGVGTTYATSCFGKAAKLMNATDYVQFSVYQDSGASQTIIANFKLDGVNRISIVQLTNG